MPVLRMLGATMVVLLLALVMSGVGLYLLLQGDAVENSTLTRRIQAEVQKMIGSAYSVELGATTVRFDREGFLSLAGTDVEVRRATDRQLVSKLGRIVIGVRPLSALRGDPQIDAVIVENTALDASLLAIPAATPPSDVKGALDGLRLALEKVTGQFENSRFRLFQFRDVTVTGLTLGRVAPGPVEIDSFEMRYRKNGDLTVKAELRTDRSEIELGASWMRKADGSKALDVELAGLSALEWARDPNVAEGLVGFDAVVDATANFPYSAEGIAGEGLISIASGSGLLRIGQEASTSVDRVALNLLLDPAANRLVLEESPLAAGPLQARIRGSVQPEGGDWRTGPLRLVLAADPVRREPTAEGEESRLLSANATGLWKPAEKLLAIEAASISEGENEILGEATFRFSSGSTPAVTARFAGESFDVAALKQAWPFFLSPPARQWVFDNIGGGSLSAISVFADLPPGVFGRFRAGAKMLPEQYELTADFAGVRVRTFGDLPAIEDASGVFAMKGMAVQATLAKGRVMSRTGRSVPLDAASYRVADFGVRPNEAEVRVSAAGDARDLASIAESKPLSVISRIGVSVAGISGTGDIDVVASFPVKRGLTAEEVGWNALVNLSGASSVDKLFGRQVAKANVMIEATPTQARINGTALVDGTKAELALVEPLGKSGIASERKISTILDEAGRKKLGIVLDPVVKGVIKVQMEQQQNGPQKQSVSLDDAELALPWVGWTKGKGVGGKATYSLRTEKGVTWLDDFYIEGPGFSAAGRIALDKGGLLLADFADITLNEADSFALKLDRKGKAYFISISGLRYDARSLINKLFHEKGFGEGEGETDVSVKASLGEVRGFNGRTLRNVELSYGTAKGKFDNLSLRGSFSDSTYIGVHAVSAAGQTTFEIESSEAGGALAFIDIYSRMKGGDLKARLQRTGDGPFTGPVRATNFLVEDEPRLARLVSEPPAFAERGASQQAEELRRLDVKRVRFQEARGTIEKGEEYFRIANGVFNNNQIGFTFDGLLYDERDRMDLVGTFLPAIGLSRAMGVIPFVGEILGNGKDTGLFGVTFRLRGSLRNPQMEINPMSLVTPGVFRKVFEFRN